MGGLNFLLGRRQNPLQDLRLIELSIPRKSVVERCVVLLNKLGRLILLLDLQTSLVDGRAVNAAPSACPTMKDRSSLGLTECVKLSLQTREISKVVLVQEVDQLVV